MNELFANRLSSEAYVTEMHVTPPLSGAETKLPSMTMAMEGSENALKRMETKIRAAADKEKIEIQTNFISLLKNKEQKGGFLSLAFYHLSPNQTPEKILGLVHGATMCGIGASISANISDIETSSKEPDEKMLYLTGVRIDITQKDKKLRKIVANYIRDKLQTKYEYSYSLSNQVGEIGLPREYFYDGSIVNNPNNHDDMIFLTFNDMDTNNHPEAKQASNSIAEHLSGELGIPEQINGHSKGGGNSIPNSRRWS